MRRILCIDILKFLAVICVVNSHMDVCYPGKWSALASGGAIGDALFFFCSGYTLFLGRMDGFVPWFKRRLWRILPSTLLCVVAFALMYGGAWWDHTGGYWFVRCILIYYVAIYVIRKWMMNRLPLVFALIVAVVLIWFYGFGRWTSSIYANGYFMWLHYFVPMLMGAVLGGDHSERKPNGLTSGCMSLAMFVLFYGWCWLTKRYDFLQPYQILSLPLLWGIVYFLYRAVNCVALERLCGAGVIHWIIMLVGGLCLEVYLCHRPFLTDALNGWFPLNIAVLFAAILMLAYAVRCVIRFVVQTLQWQGHYDWRAIVKMV